METATAKKTPTRQRPQDQVPAATAGKTEATHMKLPSFRRRNFLIDRSSQLRSVLVVGLLTLGLLVPINLAMQAAETASSVDSESGEQRRASGQVLAGSIALLLAAMGITLFATHRTAGAAFNLRRTLDALCDGNYGLQTRLRDGDRLRAIEASINRLSETLYERSVRMDEELGSAAEAVERISDPQEAQAVAEQLRRMARQQPHHR